MRVLKPGGKFYTGIRLKHSMEKFPFTKYGFTMYEAGDWQAITEKNGFVNTAACTLKEPDVDISGQRYEVYAACIEAEKPAD